MRLRRLLAALARRTTGARAIRDWSVYATRARRMSLGIKDRQAGNAHTPLSLSESARARYLLVWGDGRVSRGLLERRQLERDVERALDDARAAAYDDADAARVLGPARFPAVPLHDTAAADAARGDTAWVAERLRSVRRLVDEHGFRTWSGSFGAAEGDGRLVTSAGLDIASRATSIGWHVTVNGEIGDGFRGRAPENDSECTARLARLARLAHELEREAEPRSGGVQPLILHPRVV